MTTVSYYYNVNDVYNDHCLDASYAGITRPRSTDVYTGTARGYLESGSDKVDEYGDALLKLQSSDGVKTTLEVLFVINAALGGLSVLFFLFSRSGTEDMDNTSFDINPAGDGIFETLKAVAMRLLCFVGDDISVGGGAYSKVPAAGKDNFKDPYTRRTVQLRGQF